MRSERLVSAGSGRLSCDACAGAVSPEGDGCVVKRGEETQPAAAAARQAAAASTDTHDAVHDPLQAIIFDCENVLFQADREVGK